MIAISVSILVLLLIALGLAARRALSTGSELPLNAAWIDELSIERYRPMMRLLNTADLDFLRSQPGCNPRMAARLRRDRERIFREYLRCLTSDFRLVCTAVKVLMLHSRKDRPDLAAALAKAQAGFAAGIFVVQARLILWRWGLCDVDISAVLKTFDGVRIELRTMVPAGLSAAA